mmetsp:Transcript_6918/g.6076  ORF Transcript_6918/g.6076 Transcript_6918/m.6076 type:complete len:371 (-) Transcript_6918:21-1133(-)
MENLAGVTKEQYLQSEKIREELIAEDPELQQLFDHPLNATKITPELLENPIFQGLQSLVYEGTDEEISKNFLKYGLDSLLESHESEGDKANVKLADAMSCFTRGIEQGCKDKQVNYELHLYMARCEFHQKNYGKLKNHVDEALKHKKTSQLYYYGAVSRLNLQKWQECIDYCKDALIVDENHDKCKSLMQLALTELVKEKKKMQEMALINQLEEAKMKKLYGEIKKYGIKIGKKLHFIPQDIGANLYIDDYNNLHFPVIILYDEFMQCDFIQDFPMLTSFREQLTVVLSQAAPWDPSHRNKLSNIEVFFETNITEPLDSEEKIVEGNKYVKVDLDSNLITVLKDEKHVVPQYPIFIVVAKDYTDFAKYSS